jgi:hypothetical protein
MKPIGHGSIYKIRVRRKNGWRTKYRGQITVGHNPRGNSMYRTVEADTRAECQDKLNELIAKLKVGIKVENKQTVGEFLDEWLKRKISIRESTRESYGMHLRRHLRPLAGIRLQELDALTIQDWLNVEVRRG